MGSIMQCLAAFASLVLSSELPNACVAVLLICISGAVILHFITRYLYLRAHRQMALEGLQQAAASGSPGTRSSQAPGTDTQPDVEMHTVKPTVLVVQPDEEVSIQIPKQSCLSETPSAHAVVVYAVE